MAQRPEQPKEEQQTNQQTGQAAAAQMPAYLQAALRLPASLPLGADTNDSDVLLGYSHSAAISGIIVLDYIPTLGVSADANSSLNRAAYLDQNYIRSQISGNRPYEPPDHMIYRMCVDSMRELFTYAVRIYRTLNAWNALNLYQPRYILEAMGLDYEDWSSNLSNLYQWIRSHLGALTPFPTVPMGNISQRRIAWNSFFFRDGDTPQAQTYIINQKCFWSYEKVDEVKGITPVQLGRSYAEFTTLWDSLYAALQASSDVYIIAADIRRAFGDRVVTDIPLADLSSPVEFVKMDPILLGIMNANIIPFNTTDDFNVNLKKFRIYDDAGTLKCTPTQISMSPHTATVDYQPYTGASRHINVVQQNPTEMDLLNAIRLRTNIVNVEAAAGNDSLEYGVICDIASMGTEVIIGARIVTTYLGGTRYSILPFGSLITPIEAPSNNPAIHANFFNLLASISQFDWHPPVWLVERGSGRDYTPIYGALEDIQNYIPVSVDQLKLIHDNLILTEFNMPG